MKRSLINGLAASALVLSAMTANAADELVIYVFKDGQAASDLVVRLDGQEEQAIGSAGSVAFDLSAGGHSIQILRDGQTVHSFRFDTALGQLTDINVALSDSGRPKVAVESFFKTETASERAKAPKGVLSGRVVSGGAPVEGALIEVDGENYSTVSGADGSYQLELPRGEYQLTISHPDMRLVETDARVVSNVTKGLNLTMRAKQGAPSIDIAMPQIEEVTVLATFDPNAFEADERFSANVIDTIGIEQLARFGDSDVSASVVRLPSVTVQDDSFIFIRGLGGRYVTTTLNGSTMPSTNPNRRSVPLDLFPSNIVSQLDVKKTFIAGMPGESTGGNLVINTRTFPDERAGKFSVKLGYNQATGNTVNSDPADGDFDLIGWDDGSRREPGEVQAISYLLDPELSLGLDPGADEAINLNPDAERQLRQVAGLSMLDNWDLDSTTATPKLSFGGNFGDVFYVGDHELGYFGAFNYSNEWSLREDGIRRTYEGSGDVRDNFEFEESIYNVDISGLFSIGLALGDSTLESNTLLSRVTTNRIRLSEGLDGDALERNVSYFIEWEERTYLSQQFTGEHFLNESGDFIASWQVTGSFAQRYAPDLREVTFTEETRDSGVFSVEIPELTRRFEDLVDYNFDISNDYEWVVSSDGNRDQALTFGWQYIYRERDSESASYGFDYGFSEPDFDETPNLLVSDVVSAENITGDRQTGLAYFTRTLKSDSYDSEMDLTSLFIDYDILLDSTYQFILGARYEEFNLETDTFQLSGQQERSTEPPLDTQNLLPSLSFNWLYSESQQLRFALSQTVSRPDFKERSNAVFQDREAGNRVRGNPNLEESEILNADIRWEGYWNDNDNLSVALFYKDISDAIERVVVPASGTAGNTRSFDNAPQAEIYGVEIDGRIEFGLNDALTQTIFIAGNASVIESEVTLDDGATRQLQGQPDYTFNLVLGWDDIENGHELTILFNQNGESISDLGIQDLPDIILEPFADLKINYKKSIGEDLNLSLKFSNLLDSEFEFTQGGQVFQSFRDGVEAEAGFDWSF